MFIPSATCPRCSDAKVTCGFDGIGKVAAEPFRAESSSTGLSVFCPKTLLLPATRLKGIRQRKQATDLRFAAENNFNFVVINNN